MNLDKRTWVYVQRPAEYEIAGCPCGNADPEWSEYKGHLWCAKCQKDFIPEHNGIFDGPIPVNGARLMGICLDRFNLETQKIEKVFDSSREVEVISNMTWAAQRVAAIKGGNVNDIRAWVEDDSVCHSDLARTAFRHLLANLDEAKTLLERGVSALNRDGWESGETDYEWKGAARRWLGQ